MTEDPIRVSVVVAAWEEEGALRRTLSALAQQAVDGVEILVVGNFEAPRGLGALCPHTWLRGRVGDLVPHLWARGLAAARGDLVATTTSHFEPAADWLARLLSAIDRLAAAGVGGAIDPPVGESPTHWATYFLRYANYSRRREESATNDLAADNALYRRRDLLAHRETWEAGFWEPDFHRRLAAGGGSLHFVPDARVRMRGCVAARRFCALRRRHGRQFGRSRASSRSPAWRLAAALAAPLIPAVLAAKVTRRALAQPALLGRFLVALPLTAAFVLCWSLGEATGYWQALFRSR